MKFLVDQDVYLETINFLKYLRHDVIVAKEIGMQTATDVEILQKAQQMNRILVSRDKDFGALVFFKHKLMSGVVFLRIKPSDIDKIHETLKLLFEKYSEEELQHCFCVVEAEKYRIRHIR
jgi:predicted nuclease of predicted toxin-antitoxin system